MSLTNSSKLCSRPARVSITFSAGPKKKMSMRGAEVFHICRFPCRKCGSTKTKSARSFSGLPASRVSTRSSASGWPEPCGRGTTVPSNKSSGSRAWSTTKSRTSSRETANARKPTHRCHSESLPRTFAPRTPSPKCHANNEIQIIQSQNDISVLPSRYCHHDIAI